MSEKRVCLTLNEKLWIIEQRAENENITQPKIALDFQAKFKRSVTRQCISQAGVLKSFVPSEK